MKKERVLGFIFAVIFIASSFFVPLSAVFAQTDTNNDTAGVEEVTIDKQDETEEETIEEEKTEETTETEKQQSAADEKTEIKKSKTQAETRANENVSNEQELRDAVISASAGDIITLTANISVSGAVIDIDKELTIEGSGKALTFTNNTSYIRLFNITDTGKLTINNTDITNISIGNQNGGIHVQGGELVIKNTSFKGIDHDEGVINIAYNYSPKGKLTMISGAIENNKVTSAPIVSEGVVVIESGSISNNISTGMAGALYNGWSAESMTIHNVVIKSNESQGNVGGIYNASKLEINDCAIKDNKGTLGGGVQNAGTMIFNKGVISGNEAFQGGGIYSFISLGLTIGSQAVIENNKAVLDESEGYFYAGSGGGLFLGGIRN